MTSFGIRKYRRATDYWDASALLDSELGKGSNELLDSPFHDALVAVIDAGPSTGDIVGILVYTLRRSAGLDVQDAKTRKTVGMVVVSHMQEHGVHEQLEEALRAERCT